MKPFHHKGHEGTRRNSENYFVSFVAFVVFFSFTSARAADCIPFDQAKAHIGETKCVSGKVLKVGQSQGGTMFLDFCSNYRTCPFTVVVFPSKLRDVGDVRQLEGKDIQISGKIRKWGNRAEIILENVRQLKGDAAQIPPLPKTYDVERKGSFSAGEFKKPKKK